MANTGHPIFYIVFPGRDDIMNKKRMKRGRDGIMYRFLILACMEAWVIDETDYLWNPDYWGQQLYDYIVNAPWFTGKAIVLWYIDDDFCGVILMEPGVMTWTDHRDKRLTVKSVRMDEGV